MKKIYILAIVIFVLYSCFNNSSNDEINQAKQELLNQEITEEVSDDEESFLDNSIENETEIVTTDENISQEDQYLSETNIDLEEDDDTEDQVSIDKIEKKVFESKSINPQVPELQVTEYDDLSNLTCENIDEFLQGLSGYYYWNTCRDLNDDILTNYFLEIKSGEYEYSKLYFNKSTNNFGKLYLESGVIDDLENIPTINSELKDKEFNIVEVGDELFINY